METTSKPIDLQTDVDMSQPRDQSEVVSKGNEHLGIDDTLESQPNKLGQVCYTPAVTCHLLLVTCELLSDCLNTCKQVCGYPDG